MELKKCNNCGAFITAGSDLCTSCSNVLNYNKTILKGYFDTTSNFGSISSISSNTGVSPTIVENFMLENHFIDSRELEKTSFANIPY